MEDKCHYVCSSLLIFAKHISPKIICMFDYFTELGTKITSWLLSNA